MVCTCVSKVKSDILNHKILLLNSGRCPNCNSSLSSTSGMILDKLLDFFTSLFLHFKN